MDQRRFSRFRSEAIAYTRVPTRPEVTCAMKRVDAHSEGRCHRSPPDRWTIHWQAPHDDNRISPVVGRQQSDSDQRLGSDHERWWKSEVAKAIVRWNTATPNTGRQRRSVTHGWTAALIGASMDSSKVDEN